MRLDDSYTAYEFERAAAKLAKFMSAIDEAKELRTDCLFRGVPAERSNRTRKALLDR